MENLKLSLKIIESQFQFGFETNILDPTTCIFKASMLNRHQDLRNFVGFNEFC